MQQYGVSPPVVTPKMLEYASIRYALLFVQPLVVVVTLFIVLQTGLSAKLRDWAKGLAPNKFVQLALFLLVLTVTLTLLRLPYNIAANYYLEHAFALSTQSFSAWLADLLKERAVGLVEIFIGWTVIFAAIERFPRKWPFAVFAILVPIIAALIFVYPLFVDPLFNRYAPMEQGAMRSSIEGLAKKAGASDAPVFVVDKSRQTVKFNAEVTGLGSSARINIWDTLLKLPDDQVLAVVAHELGHYALNHILQGFAWTIAGTAVLLYFVSKFHRSILALLPKRWGISALDDLAVIPAAMLLATLFGFLMLPFVNGISRTIESEADSFGLRLSNNGPATARAFVSLSQQNLADPDPPALIQWWFYGHPSLRQRIKFALGIK